MELYVTKKLVTLRKKNPTNEIVNTCATLNLLVYIGSEMRCHNKSDNLNFIFVKDLQQVVRHKLTEAIHECCHLVPDTVTKAPLHHQPVPTTAQLATVSSHCTCAQWTAPEDLLTNKQTTRWTSTHSVVTDDFTTSMACCDLVTFDPRI